MENQKVKKIALNQRIRIKIRQIIDKINKKYNENIEMKSFVNMTLDIIITGALLTFAYLSFVTPYIIFKILGFGSLLWIVKNKLVGIITEILGSVKLVSINR